MEENHKPRRWFRFSLRTMLVLVTLVCLYLGMALNWKRQREAFLKPGMQVMHDETPAPLLLRIVGARGYGCLILPEPTDQELAEAKRLFPEADVIYAQGGYTRRRLRNHLPEVLVQARESHRSTDRAGQPLHQGAVRLHVRA